MIKERYQYYMSQPYRLEIFPDVDEGGYAATYPELSGCITCADTLEEVVKNAVEAKQEWIWGCLEEGIKIPEAESYEEYSGKFGLRIPKDLHRSLARHAKEQGVSLNQYCLYLLSRNDALFLMNHPDENAEMSENMLNRVDASFAPRQVACQISSKSSRKTRIGRADSKTESKEDKLSEE